MLGGLDYHSLVTAVRRSVRIFGIQTADLADGSVTGVKLAANAAAPEASGRNFAGGTNSGTPNSKVDFTADEVVLKTSGDSTVTLYGVSVTADITVSGANGLDTGSEASDTWYYLWLIYNGTTVAGLLSTSATAPTMPSGYTYKALVSAVRNNGSSNFVPYTQEGMTLDYSSSVSVLAGGTATVETAISLLTTVPAIARQIKGSANAFVTGGASAGTDTVTFNVIASGANFQIPLQASASSTAYGSGQFTFPNVSRNIYYKHATGGTVAAQQANLSISGFRLPGGGE